MPTLSIGAVSIKGGSFIQPTGGADSSTSPAQNSRPPVGGGGVTGAGLSGPGWRSNAGPTHTLVIRPGSVLVPALAVLAIILGVWHVARD
jgi:hypothetical protein